MIPPRLLSGAKAAAILSTVSLTLAVSKASAQPVGVTDPNASTTMTALGAEENFGFELGRAVVDRGGGASSVYTVAATQDYRSKSTGAKVRLTVVEKDAAGTMTHLLTINTGKHKTVAQLSGMLADILRKYLGVAAANQEIGKIGDIDHGGEIRFVAESNDNLRYDWMTPGEPAHSTRFKKSDIQIFLGILTHPKAGG